MTKIIPSEVNNAKKIIIPDMKVYSREKVIRTMCFDGTKQTCKPTKENSGFESLQLSDNHLGINKDARTYAEAFISTSACAATKTGSSRGKE